MAFLHFFKKYEHLLHTVDRQSLEEEKKMRW